MIHQKNILSHDAVFLSNSDNATLKFTLLSLSQANNESNLSLREDRRENISPKNCFSLNLLMMNCMTYDVRVYVRFS